MAEDIVIPKAPKGWRPTSDQRQRIQQDPRLQRMSPDEQYFFFNQPKIPTQSRTTTQRAAPRQAPQRRATQNGVWGWIDQVLTAMRGG